MNRPIIIGTRGSALALWQAHFTQAALVQLGYEAPLQIIKTQGDVVQLSFSKIEGKGFFTKEIEQALLEKTVDLAVHSHKDLPTESPEGLLVVANSYRENPADWLLINPQAVDKNEVLQLRKGATVGTSSSRRKSQLLAMRPDLQFVDIRGNVATRLAKANTEVDAVVLAAAGISRLGLDLTAYHCYELAPQECIPAPAQGVLAFQIREDDANLHTIVQQLHDPNVAACIAIERQILQHLGGGCQQPIGVYAEQKNGQFHVWATHSRVWDSPPRRLYRTHHNPNVLVQRVVDDLLAPPQKAVFVSRSLDTNSHTYRILHAKYEQIYHHSLLTFRPIALGELPDTVWIFFSSQQAVQHFFEQRPSLPTAIQIAAIGAATAQKVQQYGYTCSFVGNSTDTPAQIAEQFATLAAHQSVLFPQARQSLRSIQQHLPVEAAIIIHDMVVYHNESVSQFSLPECDTLVFTSPMNVVTYCQFYDILPHQKVVAIGKSTAAALEKAGCHHYQIAYSTDELALVDAC